MKILKNNLYECKLYIIFFYIIKKKLRTFYVDVKYIYIAIPHQKNYEIIHVDINYKKIRGKVLIN
jgi:hypothetical protein